ncbi:MAG: hypothetical protein R3B09_01745 [Nannocystaceae bacterium]
MDGAKLVKYEGLPDGDIPMEKLEKLRRLILMEGGIEMLMRCIDSLPRLITRCETLEDRYRNLQARCEAQDRFIEMMVCPAQKLFSNRTIRKFSDIGQVNLDQVVPGLGAPYVNSTPVPPNSKIRYTHRLRPGFTPKEIAIDFNLAGGATNYSDLILQFYIVPGGVNSVSGLEIGAEMRGNQFLNKNGTQIHIPWPTFENCPIDVGSSEQLVLDITNAGGANNLDSAFVTLYYDNKLFYALCRQACGCETGC